MKLDTDQITGQILATAFSEGRTHDFALFKASRTVFEAAPLCLADSGYQGLDKLCDHAQTPKKQSKRHPLTEDEKANNRSISRQRIGCEHVIGRLKVFRILKECYRNRRRRFGLRFNLIAAICNIERAT
jgi:transposase